MANQAIRRLAAQFKVPFLLHFTRASNLPSIMQHGLLPIAEAERRGIEPEINDNLRLDGRLDGTSVSIGFPNCKMLYKYMTDDEAIHWSILVLEPSILWEKDCAFCKHNAADRRISGQPLPDLKTPAALASMFEEIDGYKSRSDQRLKSYDPTDEQAEVLVFDAIEPELIGMVTFDSEAAKKAYSGHLGDRKVVAYKKGKGLFANRKYARTWG